MVPEPHEPGAEAQACAQRVLFAAPRIMRVIRREMRGAAQENLSVPQFRTMAFLQRNPGASMSAAAEHLGVTKATASVLVDRLVNRGLVKREGHPEERRRVMLGVTDEGKGLLERSRSQTQAFIAARLAGLPDEDLRIIAQGVDLLSRALDIEGMEGPSR